jgi:hypothetical protein
LSDDLEPAKKVLRKFLAEIEEVKAFHKNISQPQLVTVFLIKDRMPVFDTSEFNPASDDYWEKEDAYIWLYADAWDFRAFMHRSKSDNIPEYYNRVPPASLREKER